jgi:Domain of unknown function (DUF305)
MDYDGFFSDISTVLSPEASKGTPMRRDTSTFVTAGLANEGGTSVKPKVSTGFACRLLMTVAAIALAPVAFAQPLADYISAICAKSLGSAPAAEAPYLFENVSAMTKMMIDMGIRPSGDVDTDFVAMMVPHHQGAIEMAQAELRYGRNEQLKRLSQEIIVTQQQEIVAMRLALGEPLPLPAPAPDQVRPAGQNESNSSRFAP